jgi:hypothetical protein
VPRLPGGGGGGWVRLPCIWQIGWMSHIAVRGGGGYPLSWVCRAPGIPSDAGWPVGGAPR